MSYRAATVRCPGCGDALEPYALGDAEIDVCPSCRGIWLDWFDGEVTSLVRKARKRPELGTAGGSAGATGARTPCCPRCAEALTIDFVHGVGLLRCRSCIGVFVERQNVATLADVTPPTEREPSEAWDLARLVRRLRAFLFGALPSTQPR